MVYCYWNNLFGSKQSSLSDFSIFANHFVVFSSSYFKQKIRLNPILGQHNPNNWPYIGRWSIANMLQQYHIIIGCWHESNVTSANGKPILTYLSTRYCQWKPNIESMWLDKRTPTPISPTGNQRWANYIFKLSGLEKKRLTCLCSSNTYIDTCLTS